MRVRVREWEKERERKREKERERGGNSHWKINIIHNYKYIQGSLQGCCVCSTDVLI